jgi:hypothetical protein
MLKKFCSKGGCKELVNIDQTYCTKHQMEYEEGIRLGQKNMTLLSGIRNQKNFITEP